MEAREISLNVSYNGTNISTDIAKYMKSFGATDNLSGQADTVDITLQDKKELWMGDWMPEKGDTLEVSLHSKNWGGDGDSQELKMGKFEIDEVESSFPPHEVKLKAISVPDNAEIRGVEKTRSWEKTKLSVIAKDIAGGAGLELYYDTDEDPELDRAEQSSQSDLDFLMKLCKDNGLALKVSDKQIIIFDEQKYEKADPVRTITNGESALKSFQVRSKSREVYKACHVKYKHSKKDEMIEYTYTDPNKEKGSTLEVNEKVKDLAEAEKLAKKKLREKNCEEVTVSASMVGAFDLLASNTVKLSGFHKFDGKYIITKAGHSIGGGYSVSLDLRRCLDGY